MPTAMEFRFVLDDQTARTQGSQGVTAPGTSSPDVPQGGDPFAGSRTRFDGATPAFATAPPHQQQPTTAGSVADALKAMWGGAPPASPAQPGGIPAFEISGTGIPKPTKMAAPSGPYMPPGGWEPSHTPLLDPVPPRPPETAEDRARQRYEREERKKQDEEAYKRLYGEELKEWKPDELKQVSRDDYEKHQRQERARPYQDAAGMAARAGVPGAGAAGQAMGAFASGNPAGGAFAAIDAAKEVVGKFAQVIDEASERVRKFGKFQEDIVRNDYIAAGKKLYDAGGDQISGMTGLGGPAVKAALNNGLARFEAWQGVNNAIVERGKELSPYSGELASANAMARVRTVMADIKEAQDMGASMAKVVEAQSKTDAYIRETIGPWKQAWMESKAKESAGQSKIVEGFAVAAKDKDSTIGQMNDVLLLLYRISKGLDPMVGGKKDDKPSHWESFFADAWLGERMDVPIAGDDAGRPAAAGDF